MIIPVILSGGSGTRLWPVSTTERPKQFQPMVGAQSMFRQTIARVADRAIFAPPVIVCGEGHAPLVAQDLAAEGVGDARILIEPAARNTAPAIALAAHLAGDAPMLVMPSDHVMTKPAALVGAVRDAQPIVASGALATFGIRPTRPETGYGYIAAGAALTETLERVARFVEKPPRDKAEAMLAAGGHYWNAGIFLMRGDAYLNELARQRGDIAAAVAQSFANLTRDGAMLRPDAAAFLACPSESIDYAVMEGAENLVVAAVDPGWSDVGGWEAMHTLLPQDAAGNASVGDVLAIDAKGNLLRADAGKRLSVLGIDNLVVIATGDDILILPRERAQEVKQIAEARKKP
ncbi:MAG: NTP transferase domain-containing protein [Sphingomonadaceae bacterium]|nr:NTP transferase domain-containing protein [Sphingomonadaceae bacterium]